MKTLKSAFGTMLLTAILALGWAQGHAQEASRRKVLDRSTPSYPALARTMALEGIVKVDSLVGPDGSVRAVTIKGGHPVLAQAATNAVRSWKWEPASRESHELIEIKFAPPE
jgi:TonB family protein